MGRRGRRRRASVQRDLKDVSTPHLKMEKLRPKYTQRMKVTATKLEDLI